MVYITSEGNYCEMLSSARYLYGIASEEGFHVEGETTSEEELNFYSKNWDLKIINPKVKFINSDKIVWVNREKLFPVKSIKINNVTEELISELLSKKINMVAL